MRRNIFIAVLIFEALVCVLLNLLEISSGGIFKVVMAFPFEQIGIALRALSLSGDVGNAIAIVIYVLFCLLPMAILFFAFKKRKLNPEDWILGLLCPVLFAVMYIIINPGIVPSMPVVKAILGSVVYSLICGYLVLRVLRMFLCGGIEQLQRYMVAMLCIMNVFFVYLVFGASLGSLIDSIASLREGNTGNESLLGNTYAFFVLHFIVDVLPYVFNIFVAFAALHMLREIQTDRYSEKTVAATKRMTKLCVTALAAAVISNMAFNLLQLLSINSLMSINTMVRIPVLSIIFVLAGLLLARFVEENKQLKEENDQFV